ncbi:unnamed protein product [Nesidiocoris tenuis]|uniref:Uncharacterized protein n=1 Tax=Nesidiocoris tenuis TaxID=355587 RepID=A0A6H5GKY6_9HEMI|nr:unnamed protein product [Nesidiocoris tenuis]
MFGYKSTLLSLGNKFMPSWISFDKLGLIDRVSAPRFGSIGDQLYRQLKRPLQIK